MKSCLDYTLHYINRFPKTEFELRLQLRKKGYTEADIDERHFGIATLGDEVAVWGDEHISAIAL